MSTTVPPMGHGTPVPPPSPLPDEHELERLFRAQHAVLMESAKRDLGDAAAAAPRLIENAFRLAWEERARFGTSAEIDEFLRENVHHAVARERSRRARLHHLEEHRGTKAPRSPAGPEPTVDESWARLAHAIHMGDNVSGAAAEAKHVLRRDAAEHVAAMARKTSYRGPITIVLVSAALAATGIWYTTRLGEDRRVLRALAAPDARIHTSGTGQMAVVNLDDGTRVTLTPNSRLIVPRNFGPKLRTVRIDGAARFAVTSTDGDRFEVHARDVRITAAGTDFAVRISPVDSTVVALAIDGQIELAAGDSTRALSTGAAAAVAKNGMLRDATAGERDEVQSWTDGRIVITERPLREVLPELRRWYGLDLKVIDLPLLDRVVSVHAPLDSPNQAISSVEESGKLKFGYEGETMVLRDGAVKEK